MITKTVPVLIECLGGSSSGNLDDPREPIFNFEAQTASGEMYIIPVSLRAAHAMLMTLANWEPMQEFLTVERAPRPKPQ